MTIKEEQAWKETLDLWHTMSTIPTTPVESGPAGFKNSILNLQGVGKRRDGCPFCDAYVSEIPKCSGCPINNDGELNRVHRLACYNTPFSGWERKLCDHHIHDQDLAKEFYDYLTELYSRYHTDRDVVIEQVAEWIDTMPIAGCIVEHLEGEEIKVTFENAKKVWLGELGHLDEDLGK